MASNQERNFGKFEIILTTHAQNNIEEIASFIAIENLQPLNAIKGVDNIYAKIESIGNNPFSYKECSGLKTSNKIYRQASCYKWLIIYKIKKNTILILGVIHGSRSIKYIKKLKS